MEARILAFIGIVVILIVTPGPDMALVTRVTLARGRGAGWLTSCGIVSGLLVWGLASGAGIAALLNTSATLYTVLRLAGAAYLIFLGVQALLTRAPTHDPGTEKVKVPPRQPLASYGQGLLNNLLNPKIGVFYTAFLPQFIQPGQPVFLMSVLLAALHALISIFWLLAYTSIVTKIGDFFRRPRVRQTMERVTGLVLVGLGLRLATEQR